MLIARLHIYGNWPNMLGMERKKTSGKAADEHNTGRPSVAAASIAAAERYAAKRNAVLRRKREQSKLFDNTSGGAAPTSANTPTGPQQSLAGVTGCLDVSRDDGCTPRGAPRNGGADRSFRDVTKCLQCDVTLSRAIGYAKENLFTAEDCAGHVNGGDQLVRCLAAARSMLEQAGNLVTERIGLARDERARVDARDNARNELYRSGRRRR